MASAADSPLVRSPLFQQWQAEAVRLRETQWGPLDDRTANQAAVRETQGLAPRILARAAILARHGTLQSSLQQWALAARLSLICLAILGVVLGVGAATAALNPARGSVNLAMALVGLLGLHALTFIIWLIGCLPGIQAGTLLSQLWWWSSKKLARGPDHVLAAQSFVSLLGRAQAWKPAVGLLSHGMWTLAYSCAIPTLIVLLSTRSYTFHWETTLLSPEAFVTLSQTLGSLPHALGFPVPDSISVAQSMGGPTAPATVQADWSLWLIGNLLCWGWLPRVLGLLVCAFWFKRRLHRIHINPALPGWLELRERLQPMHQSLGIDRPDSPADTRAAHHPHTTGSMWQPAVLALELGPDVAWPPEGLPSHIENLGRCDSREDRQRLRETLDARPLLLVCDARRTPDRGSATWLDELHQRCPQMHVWCLPGPAPRQQAWEALFSRYDLPQARHLDAWLGTLGPSPS
ncbi:DUF2868 domain-containing protein [Castellaniella sp.]|uniref:DUF2868 domain-containing protein n=1 Tax=Castellaniella sp. TaxID=1955812 RepID=UPI003C75A1AE